MKKSRYCILLFCIVAAIVSCQKTELEGGIPAEYRGSEKIFGTKAGSDPFSLLVKLSNPEDISAVSELPGVSGVRKVFNSVPGKEELEAQFGLDRWYEVSVSEESSSEKVALSLASVREVSVVEFNAFSAPEERQVYPADLSDACCTAVTKAGGEAPFNDSYLKYQWALNNTGDKTFSQNAVAGADINVFPVWEALTCGDPSIIVAVVDEGVRYSHPDLVQNMWTNTGEIPDNGKDDDGNGYVDDIHGYNFEDNGPISWGKAGDSGHGTFCAGVVSAVNGNNEGICGIAGGTGKDDGCRIMSCQIFSGNGGGTALQTAKAIKYAADNGASVITCSFGYSYAFRSDNDYISSQGTLELDAINYFEASKGNNPVLTDGNIAVFSAGNEAHNYAHYPGAIYNIISVSAMGPDFLPTNYTNYGPGCNIAAPGGERGQTDTFRSLVLSTVTRESYQNFDGKEATGFDYGYMQGTSMACPQVSGVVALALSYAKKSGKHFTRDEFKQMILSSTSDIDGRIASQSTKSYVDVSFSMDGKRYKYPAAPDLKLAPFYHQMGAGVIDAWQLMMKIDGTPCIPVTLGSKQWINLSDYLGTASVSLTYLDVIVPDETVKSLGLQKMKPQKASGTNGNPVPDTECYAYEQFGRIYVHATKPGSGKISIKVVGGGDHIGGGDNPPGGMEITTEVSIIARPVQSKNGGWL